MPEIRTGTVVAWHQLSPVLASFRLGPQKRHRFPSYEAGQYMALRREDCRLTRRVAGSDGRTRFVPELDESGRQKRGPVTHAYSIASAPFQTERDKYVEFLVVLEMASTLGRFTESLFDMEPREGGTMLYVERIVGDFTLARRTEGAGHILMVATGTGLAPLVAMVRQLNHDASSGRAVPQRVTLLFTNRTRPELAFHEELASIASAGRFDFVYLPTVSRPGDEQGREAIGRGRANNVLRLALGLPMAEEEALEAVRKAGGDTEALEATVARAVPPQLPPEIDAAALRSRLDPGATVVLTCGNPAAMEDIRRVSERQGMRVEREEW
jgi:ferredoxin-NADP reductase